VGGYSVCDYGPDGWEAEDDFRVMECAFWFVDKGWLEAGGWREAG
jgi:hypothetical protein